MCRETSYQMPPNVQNIPIPAGPHTAPHPDLDKPRDQLTLWTCGFGKTDLYSDHGLSGSSKRDSSRNIQGKLGISQDISISSDCTPYSSSSPRMHSGSEGVRGRQANITHIISRSGTTCQNRIGNCRTRVSLYGTNINLRELFV